MASERDRALDRIIELARHHGIDAAEIRSRLDAAGLASSDREYRTMTILAYIGGLFVFAGLVTALNMVWADLDRYSRVVITLGSGFVAMVLALTADRDARFRNAALPLFIIASIMQPAGLFVVLAEFSAGFASALAASAVFGAMTLQMALLFAWLRWTVTVFFAIAFGFSCVASLMSWLDFDATPTLFAIGLSGLLVSVGIARTAHAAVTPLAFAVFGAFLAFSCYDALEHHPPWDFGLIGIAAALMVLAIQVRSRTLLATSVAVTLGYLGYYTEEYFAGMLGWPVALILAGFAMIALSSYALKLGKRIRTR